MLTLVESLSLAGDRAKQNDDACGARAACAWVIDGATDLHSQPVSRAASDAAWLAQELSGALGAVGWSAPLNEHALYEIVELAHEDIAVQAEMFERIPERWRLPTASALLIGEAEDGIVGLDLGDCRAFALDANGKAFALGGPPGAADKEAKSAAAAIEQAGGAPVLTHAGSLDQLRRSRSVHNEAGGYWIFGIQPECVEHVRKWRIDLARPAHILLATDGFSALVDRYHLHDAASLMRAAVDRGLQELSRDLRAIENDDSGAARYPRWKRSDDATALLLRLT